MVWHDEFKQQIRPTEELARIIAPDLEAIAKRSMPEFEPFAVAKTTFPLSLAETRASRVDHLLPRLGRGSEAPSDTIDCPGPYSLPRPRSVAPTSTRSNSRTANWS